MEGVGVCEEGEEMGGGCVGGERREVGQCARGKRKSEVKMREGRRDSNNTQHLQTSTYGLLSLSFLSLRFLCCCCCLGYIQVNTPDIQHLPLTLTEQRHHKEDRSERLCVLPLQP